MKTWKKVVLIVLSVVVGLFAIAMINYYVKESQRKSKIEDAFALIEKSTKENDFSIARSTIRDIDWEAGRIEDGDEKLDMLIQDLVSSEFRFEVDKVTKEIKNKEIALAESRWSELLLESISNDKLTKEDKDYLTSVSIDLVATKETLMKPFMEQAEKGLSNMYVKKNEFDKSNWYRDNSSPRFIDQNGFYLYFGEEKGQYSDKILPLRLKVQYYGDDWLFHEKFQLLIDGVSYSFKPNKVDRDNGSGGYVWEWSDESLDSYTSFDYMSKRLVDIINSKEAKIKFIGDKYYEVKTITQNQKNALRNVLLAYVAKGEYFQFVADLVE